MQKEQKINRNKNCIMHTQQRIICVILQVELAQLHE